MAKTVKKKLYAKQTSAGQRIPEKYYLSGSAALSLRFSVVSSQRRRH
ncbi:MAG: hypothetical protein GY801_38065 [bacterium]|nr:hypothetical protein [bacterium]